MKLILGNDIVGAKIFHTDNEKEKTTVQDILLDTEVQQLGYLTLKLKTPTHEIDEERDRGFLELLNPFKGTDGVEKQEFLIPQKQIDRMEPGSITMLGTKVEEERVRPLMHYRPYSNLLDFHVENEDGTLIGKIKDIVFDTEKREIVGLQLGERPWGEETKYLPYDANFDWGMNKLTIPNNLSDELVDEPVLLT